MRRAAGVSLILMAFLALAVIVYLTRNRQHPHQPIVDHQRDLRKLIAEQEVESARGVANYQPKATPRIDDLAISAADILRALPGVVQVEVLVKVEKPTSRIIQLRDWHFVPKELLAIDLAEAHGRPLTQDEIDVLYEQHLLEVELVQLEQLAVLRCLIKHHGLKRVFAEGFSPAELEGYREKITGLRTMEEKQIPEIRKQLDDVRKFMAEATGERKERAKAIEAELVGLLDQHKHRLLEMGAAGRLLIAGELEDVLPLEDADAFEQAKPITPEGEVKADTAKLKARRDAQVKAVLEKGAFGLIVLGGSHDLSDNVRRLGAGNCEYLRGRLDERGVGLDVFRFTPTHVGNTGCCR